MGTPTPAWVARTLSKPRFAPYLAASGNDPSAALRLYWWNLDISAAFHVPLHSIELALRNTLHHRLRTTYERADWWSSAPLTEHGQRKVAEARESLSRLGTHGRCADDLVAQLSFGFWVSLLSSTYHRTLWVPSLHRAFRRRGVQRRRLHSDLQYVLVLRNRIMHFEPIHHRHLAADHNTIYCLLALLSPELVAELRSRDRVPEILQQRDKLC